MTCEWPTVYGEGCAMPEDWDPTGKERGEDQVLYEAMATDYLWRWTGHRFGLCSTTFRPCVIGCTSPTLTTPSTFVGRGPDTGYPTQAHPGLSVLWSIGCGRCGPCSSIDARRVVSLPGPVHSVHSVVIEEETLEPAAYRSNGDLLIRTDGGFWPTRQDLERDGGPGTWQVEYTRGVPVPPAGQVAAGVLALELSKAACGDSSCALPQRLQSITRQGVTVAVLDSFDDIDRGHTGIWLIDSWVASVARPPSPSLVYSPDTLRR